MAVSRSTSHMSEEVDAYIASRPPEHHAGLDRLRSLAHACIPGAEECISYGMPALRKDGRVVVWFASFAKHYALFPRSKAIEVFGDELAGYGTSKGTIRFAYGSPLPAVLIKRIIRFCAQEQRAASAAKNTSRTPAAKARSKRT
ncbi:MAG: iron chaperone [Candidatus Kapaibacterium sp.]